MGKHNSSLTRREVLLEEASDGPDASEPVPEFTHNKSQPLICLQLMDEEPLITIDELLEAESPDEE